MEESIVHEQENHTSQEAAENDAECWDCKGVRGLRHPVQIPQRAERSVLHKDHQVVDEKSAPAQTDEMS